MRLKNKLHFPKKGTGTFSRASNSTSRNENTFERVWSSKLPIKNNDIFLKKKKNLQSAIQFSNEFSALAIKFDKYQSSLETGLNDCLLILEIEFQQNQFIFLFEIKK